MTKQNEAEFKFKQCVIQPDCVASRLISQPNFMHNFSQHL